jgi:hypothetical protein
VDGREMFFLLHAGDSRLWSPTVASCPGTRLFVLYGILLLKILEVMCFVSRVIL